jgi:hypothetical protein
MDLVLRYSLDQRADGLGDPIDAAVQHWQVDIIAEQFDGQSDEPVFTPVGWARVTIVSRYQGANLYEAFDAIDGITKQLRQPSSIPRAVISRLSSRSGTR